MTNLARLHVAHILKLVPLVCDQLQPCSMPVASHEHRGRGSQVVADVILGQRALGSGTLTTSATATGRLGATVGARAYSVHVGFTARDVLLQLLLLLPPGSLLRKAIVAICTANTVRILLKRFPLARGPTTFAGRCPSPCFPVVGGRAAAAEDGRAGGLPIFCALKLSLAARNNLQLLQGSLRKSPSGIIFEVGVSTCSR
eukprot:scaffold8068_cov565-Prasinococcus_capsulatus_cf.AAC.10